MFNPPYIFLTQQSHRQEDIYKGIQVQSVMSKCACIQLKYNVVNINNIYCTEYALPKSTHLTIFQNKTCECPKSHFNKHTWRSKCLFQIQVHGNDWTSLYEQVPKEILPTEYGGNAGSVAEHWGESKHHDKPEIVQFYCRFISMHIVNAPQKLLIWSSGKVYGKLHHWNKMFYKPMLNKQ